MNADKSQELDLAPIKAHLPPPGFWSLPHERTIHALIAEINRLRALVPLPATPTETYSQFVMTAEQVEAFNAAKESARTILDGFDKGIFQRNITGDGESAWAIKLLPYVLALAKLQEWVER